MKIDILPISAAVAGKLEQEIPEFTHRYAEAQIEERLRGRPQLLIGAYVDDACVGYKVGYEFQPRRFYSWLGGVLPQYRRRGIALALLNWQEGWARKNGYEVIRVTSENRYRSMLIFLLKNEYDIVGVETCGAVHFQKRFVPNVKA